MIDKGGLRNSGHLIPMQMYFPVLVGAYYEALL